ncbi:MAG TPA: DNA gyrase inhibitor YacG [Stellaceae bacterium]|nr:DNA gyrase inhibitor YacG [Stellaceae bacterium]
MSDTNSPAQGNCPVCGKPTEQRYRPFCSARCQKVDLGRWFSGTYRVETDEDPDNPSMRDED